MTVQQQQQQQQPRVQALRVGHTYAVLRVAALR